MRAAPISLRPAGIADAALIADMHARSWAATYRGTLTDHFLDDDVAGERLAYWQPKMLALAAGAGAVMIAERQGVAVGFLCVIQADQDGSVLVDNLHALPGHKGGGAGTAMLEAARVWARERGARALHLAVLEANHAAIGFYESRGWRRDGQEDAVLGGTNVVALVYRLPLG